MTAPTPTPPCLGEREAVVRIVERGRTAYEARHAGIKAYEGTWKFEPPAMKAVWERVEQAVSAELSTLRTENETLRAEREQSEKHRNDLMDSIVSLKTERGALKSRLAAVDDDREAALARLETALARAERAEEEARDARYKAARYKADCEEIDEHGALSHAEEADAEIDRLTAKLAQAEGEIATMRTALDDSQSLLVMIREIAPADAGWREEGVPALLQDQISSNRAALTTPEHPHGD